MLTDIVYHITTSQITLKQPILMIDTPFFSTDHVLSCNVRAHIIQSRFTTNENTAPTSVPQLAHLCGVRVGQGMRVRGMLAGPWRHTTVCSKQR